MRQRISRIGVVLSTVVVILVGFSTLIGLLIGDFTGSLIWLKQLPLLGEPITRTFPNLPDTVTLNTFNLAGYLVRVAVVTVAMTIIIGILNLFFVNARRIYRGQSISARINSAVTLVIFVVTLVIYVLDRERSMILLEDVQVPIETALASLLFFALVYGAFRILRDGVTPQKALFVATVLVVLVGALPLAALAPVQQVTDWLVQVPVNAGASGILLGIALATIVTGIRILIGQDRTYGE